jgi:hypothetical protein
VIGYLVDGALDGIHGWDHFFRRELKQLIPNLRELIDHPAEVLAYQDVQVGPCRRYVSSIVIGLISGIGLSTALAMCLMSFVTQDRLVIRGFAIFSLLSFPVLASIFVLYLSRGGEVVLTRERVEFRYRRTRVVCPWAVFNASGDPAALSYDRLAIPVSESLHDVECFVNGEPKQAGLSVNTRQFRVRAFDRPRVTGFEHNLEAILGDYYVGRLDDIACLLLIVGRELSKQR